MVKQFKSLADLQNYLTSTNVVNTVFKDKKIKSILAITMSQAVQDIVYNHYIPKEYKRRRNNGGLSDIRNMDFTKVEVVGNTVRILFENLTMGQTHQIVYNRERDTLVGEFLTDTIVEGRKENWEKQGKWSEPRDFIGETIKRIESNPSHLIKAIKDAYKGLGFSVK